MNVKTPVPKEKSLDSTLALIKEGFHFLPSRRSELESDIFETRLVGSKAVVICGEKAAELFYDEELMKREGAAPKPLEKSLLGEGGLHGLDDEAHKHRKRMFLAMVTPERLEDMKRLVRAELEKKAEQWERTDEPVVLFNEMNDVLAVSGMRWAGLPLEDQDIKQRTRELTEMVDSFGGSLSRFRKGVKSRKSQEEWLMGIIKAVRKGELKLPENTPAYITATQRDINGKLMPVHTAAVDLNNSFRPLMATSYFLTFGAAAIYEHPETVDKIRKGGDDYIKMFSQEVRRFYPFVPAMAAIARKDFSWNDYKFKKGVKVILDIFGTNRHPDSWDNPDSFIPERFENWKESPFSFVPQGGGDHHMGHRCAGEWMTVLVMREVFKFLAEKVTYDVPEQDLSYDMHRMPTLPKSGFVITNVKRKK
ncbi:cytochrome P450 [Alteribacter natronophilus]|uniref:cytochrome P450 n=1 Tax=Alteribacter natronophilus TaxID=2583810 RepID=UPI00110EB508|nr:cytochrome P450 [Alteribacter natronophilus]TMW70727.1 cytochrome P450 [Alteribacter natronophilus]